MHTFQLARLKKHTLKEKNDISLFRTSLHRLITKPTL